MMNLNKSYEYFHPEDVDGRIHIIGCGSVGATLAENLARLGLTKFALWDFDTVEAHNIVNQIFTQKDIGRPKIEALKDILCDINPDIAESVKLYPEGWKGQQLSGYVFLCVDSIEIRQEIVKKHFDYPYIKAMFDTRTLLESAQHYAADWSDINMRKNLLASMDFTHDEAMEETPVSACGITLGVAFTVRGICALVVANFVNFIRGKGIRKFINMDFSTFILDAFE